ncbi:cytochrome c [Sphingomonas sp.]|uniref:c-type cytochrome n=1 Tax=Sphingomonas sp. TaxID=28214 RepID=UPI0026006AFC|nr:cytochrome c [Sphingomonas sp.]
MSKAFDLRRHLPSTAFVIVALLIIGAFGGIFIYLGVYNIGADAPHSKLVYGTLDEFRERSIATHARDIKVPADLNDPKRIAAGAGLYNEMCTGCHLGPGLEKSELSQGLYPAAPEFAREPGQPAAEQFWTIKHGVKMSAMPAWGKTHDDQLIWDMVAFIGQLPKMTPEQYKAAVASAPESHDEMMEHMPPMAGQMDQHDPASKPHTHAPGHEHSH